MTARPRPVLTTAGIAGLVTSVAGVLTFLGYNDASAHLSAMTTTIASVAIGVVGLGSHLLSALHSQDKVTPVSDPKSASGKSLVERVEADVVPDARAFATAIEKLSKEGLNLTALKDLADGKPDDDLAVPDGPDPLVEAEQDPTPNPDA